MGGMLDRVHSGRGLGDREPLREDDQAARLPRHAAGGAAAARAAGLRAGAARPRYRAVGARSGRRRGGGVGVRVGRATADLRGELVQCTLAKRTYRLSATVVVLCVLV